MNSNSLEDRLLSFPDGRKTISYILIFMFLLTTAVVNSQILSDKTVMDLIRKDIDHLYNFRFDSARAVQAEIQRYYPDHPVIPLLRGMHIYWENYPLTAGSEYQKLFEDNMLTCMEQSEQSDDPAHEAEYLLANLCSRGMLLTFYSDNDMISNIIPLTINTYRNIRRSFDHAANCYDLLYFTGLYNYYREAYPRMYPAFKSLAMLFPPGDTEKGLNDIAGCAREAYILGPEAYYLLSYVYMNFERDPSRALKCNSRLIAKYPRNSMYQAFLIKNMLLLRSYDEAESIISEKGDSIQNRFFRAQLCIFKGIIAEKKYKDMEQAGYLYNKGIEEIISFGDYGNEYASYAYSGLSRISSSAGDRHASRIYREKAGKLSEFKNSPLDH